jgi:hypothetical protein
MTERKENLARLDRLVGMWDAAPMVDGTQVMRGTAEIAWTEDGAFLVQRVTNEMLETTPQGWRDNAPRSTVWMIGLDDDAYTVLYADSRGVHRVYGMRFDGRTWTMQRDAPDFPQRFVGELSDDDETINGRWERSENGGRDWLLDFEMVFTRIR